VPLLDLIPRKAGVDRFEAATDFATPAQSRRLLGPPAAARSARLEVMVAGKAQDQQVALRIVATPEDAQPVVDVELALRA
jgi:hypothetical protein